MNLGNGGSSAGIMKDFLDNSANVTLLFGIVKRSELDCTLSSSDMRLEDRGLTLSLGLQHVVGAVEEPTKRVKANRKDSWVSDVSYVFYGTLGFHVGTYLDVFTHGETGAE